MSKKLRLLILIPALLLIGGYLFIRFTLQSSIKKEEAKTGAVIPDTKKLGSEKLSEADLRPLFIKRLQQLLKNGSAGLYNLSIADLKIDVLASTVTLQGVSIKPDSTILSALKKEGKTPADVFTVSFDSLQIDGVNIDDAINSKAMEYKLVKLVRPLIIIHHIKAAAKKESGSDSTFQQRFLRQMERLSVKKVVVEDGTLALYNDTKKSGVNKINHLSVLLNDVLIDSSTRNDVGRPLFAKDATISMKDYSRPTKDGLYVLKIGSAVIKAPQGDMQLADLSFTSPLSKQAFTQRHQFSASMYQLRLPSVTIHKVDWWLLLNEEEIVADGVTADNGTASVYLDRSLPSKPTFNNFPNQLLMKLAMPVHIEKIALTNMNFSYEEFNPFSVQSGTLYMDGATVTIAHLSNRKSKNSPPVVVTARALFMHSVPITASFGFSTVNAVTGDFTSQVKAGAFDTRIVNSFAVPMGMVKVEKGFMDGIEADIKGSQSGAAGNVFLPYRDLKISLMEKNKDGPGLNPRRFTSALANFILIKNNNPASGPKSRHETTEYKAPPGTPFFGMVWKTVLVGALKTIGAPKKIAYETTEPPKKK